MRTELQNRLTGVLTTKRSRTRWQRLAFGWMVVVMLVTTYALILPGISLTSEDEILCCPLSVHTHTEDCYEEDDTGTPQLICGLADFVVHSHDTQCYGSDGALLCTLPEVELHTHDESCIRQTLACNLEESASHTHSDTCYQEEVGCGKAEVILHTHTTDCYEVDENGVSQWICGQLEVSEHVHGAGCFAPVASEATESSQEPEESSGTDTSAVEPTESPSLTEEVSESADTQAAIQETVDMSYMALFGAPSAASLDEEDDAISILSDESESSPPTLDNQQGEILDITPGDSISVSIPKGCRLYYRMKGYAGHSYTLVSTNYTSDPYVWLYDANGTLLASDDDSGTGYNFSLTYAVTNPGTYYWGVGRNSDSAATSYTITLTQVNAHSFTDGVCTICGCSITDIGGTIGASGNEKNVTWYLDENFVLHIEGTGPMRDFSSGTAPWYAYRSQITGVAIGSGVTNIGSYAFYNCSKLTEITIPESVTTIGSYAFSSCSKLTEITIPEGVTNIGSYAFYYCSALQRVTLPDTLTTIGSSAFYYCSKLTEITIPEGVTSIGSSAFYYCSALQRVTLPDTLTSIGSSAFYYCSKLTEITIPEGVTSIGSSAFYSCSALQRVTLPDTLTSIGPSAFSYCSALQAVTLPAALTSIGSSAFYGCTGLETLVYDAASLTSVTSDSFSSCSKIQTCIIGADVDTLNTSSLNYMIQNTTTAKTISFCGPNSFTVTGDDLSFANLTLTAGNYFVDESGVLYCLDMESGTAALVLVPSDWTPDSYDALLTSVTADDMTYTVTSIASYAFRDCTHLTSLTIPASITSVKPFAFYGCTNLTSVNGQATVSGALSALGACATSVSFWNTGLSTDNYTVTDKVECKKDDDTGKAIYDLFVTASPKKSGSSYVVSDATNTLYTGANVTFSINLNTSDSIKEIEDDQLRIYFQADEGSSLYDAASQTLFCSASTTDGTLSSGYPDDSYFDLNDQAKNTLGRLTFHSTDVPGRYYISLSGLMAGKTLNYTADVTFPVYTAGGTVLCWVDDSGGTKEPTQVLKYDWVTNPDSFTLTDSAYSTNSVTISSDGTENGLVTVSNLAYSVTMTPYNTSVHNGKNPIDYAVFTDLLTLPEGFQWRDGLLDAIRAGNWNVISSSSTKTYTVTIPDETTGQTTTVTLLTLSVSTGSSSNLSPGELSVTEDGQVAVHWTWRNTAAKAEITKSAVTVTYGSQVIIGNTDALRTALGETTSSITRSFTNSATAVGYYRYDSEPTTQTDSRTVSKSISQPDYTLSKYTSGTSTSSSTNMGKSAPFTLVLKNSTVLSVDGPRYLYDTLPCYYYIKPEDMEAMLTDTPYGQNLTITITSGILCPSNTQTVITGDGSSATVDPILANNGALYSVNTSETVSSHKAEGGTEQSVTIVIGWSADGSCWQVTVTPDGESAKVYSVGENQAYTTLSQLLDTLGFLNGYSTQYKCEWLLSDAPTLWSGETRTFATIRSSAKTSFMLMTADRNERYADSNCSSTSSYISSSYTKNVAYAKTDSTATTAKSASASYTIYRDLTLTKTVTNDSDSGKSEYVAGDVLRYTVTVSNSSTASYQAAPLIDKLMGGQLLLVPVENNSNLANLNLTTTTVSGNDYYVLNQEGTYYRVTVGGYVADHITVTKSGTTDGVVTMIYWYLGIPSSGTTAPKVNYYTLVDPTDAMGNGATFQLNNQVWLGDHGSRRLYDYTGLTGRLLSMEKKIVTNYPSGEDAATHDPTTDTTADFSFLYPGATVTYRLSVTSIGSSEDFSLTLKGGTGNSSISDLLPGTCSNFWQKDQITITYVTEDSSTAVISDETAAAWDVVSVTGDSNHAQKLQWNDSFSIQLRGTLYIYVTITLPDLGSEAWTNLCATRGGNELTNTWSVCGTTDSVTHELAMQQEGVLQKGVYSTGTMSSKSSYYNTYKTYNSSSTGRQNYTNDSSSYGFVQYYITVYNSGSGRLYLNDIQDVLPQGFSYNTSYGKPTSVTNMTLVDQDGRTISCTQKSASIAATTSKVGTQTRITFSVTISGCYDSKVGAYYLPPNSSLTFAYTVQTNGYSDTEDRAENVAGMAAYDYCKLQETLGLEPLVLKETVSVTPNANTGSSFVKAFSTTAVPANDGTGQLVSAAEATAQLHFDTSSTADAKWLTSSVTVERGQIKPGITKTVSVTQAGFNDQLNWTVKVTNAGSEAIRGYLITDVMMSPYTFTGTIIYQLYSSTSSTSALRTVSISTSDLPAVGAGWKDVLTSTSNAGTVRARQDTDASGNIVLTLYFTDVTKAAIPGGGYGALTLSTKNSTTTMSNEDFVNTAYLTPTTQQYKEVDQGLSLNAFDVYCDGETQTAMPSVRAQAQVTVSNGYATGATKSVTELQSSTAADGATTLTASTNKATNTDSENFIILENGADSIFRYHLTVNNSGGSGDSKSIDRFVLIDSLPQEGDHSTFYTASPRYSEFQVDFYANNLDLQVYTVVNGSITNLAADQYTLLFSDQTSLDYTDNQALWDGNTPDSGNWYTLEECQTNGTLSQMRTFRLVISDTALMPAGVQIHVQFNATVNKDSDPTYSEIAWNSFGYRYWVNNVALQSSPIAIGVKMPGSVFLEKELIDPSKKADQATQAETFQFIFYQGAAQELVTSTDVNELARQLSEKGIPFLVVERTVAAGASSSGDLVVDGLNAWRYNADTGQAVENADTPWQWQTGTSYTVLEVPTTTQRDYDFYSLDGSSHNSITFTFNRKDSQHITCVNQHISWELDLLKQDRQTGDALSGAVFALYTENQSLQQTMTTDTATQLGLDSPAAASQEIDGTTWYLMSWGTTDTSGSLKWSGLMETDYYIQEIKPPTGYEMNVNQGQLVHTTETRRGNVPVTVWNDLVVVLPKTGGIGTQWYGRSGAALLLLGGLLYFAKRKRNARRGH